MKYRRIRGFVDSRQVVLFEAYSSLENLSASTRGRKCRTRSLQGSQRSVRHRVSRCFLHRHAPCQHLSSAWVMRLSPSNSKVWFVVPRLSGMVSSSLPATPSASVITAGRPPAEGIDGVIEHGTVFIREYYHIRRLRRTARPGPGRRILNDLARFWEGEALSRDIKFVT